MSDTPKLVDPNGVVISAEMLERARARRRNAEQASDFALRAFAPAKPPPGVLPASETPLALDAAVADWSASDTLAWASEGYYASSYAEGTTFLGYSALSLMAQRAEYRVVSQTIAEDATREWIEIEVAGDEDKSEKKAQLEKEIDRLHLQNACYEAVLQDGLLGRAHWYIDTGDTDDKDELKRSLGYGDTLTEAWFLAKGKEGKPLQIQAIRPVEATWAYPTRYEASNPLAGDWYNPDTWYVMATEIHRSRFLTFVGRPVPDMLKPAFSFGGLSLTQMIKPYVDNWLQTRQAVTNAVTKYSTNVLKTTMGAAAMGVGSDRFWARVDFFNAVRDNSGTLVVDKETEDFVNISMPLGGLEALQAQSQEHMAAVPRIPLVKLFGIHPAGLNASVEGDIEVYGDMIHGFQEKFVRPNLDQVIRLLHISLWGKVDPDITWSFKALRREKESERVANEKTRTDIDASNIADGIIKPEEARQRIASDKESQYAGLSLDPEDVPEPPEPEMPPGMESEEAEIGAPIEEDEVDSKFSKIAAQFEHPAKGDDHCGECVHFLAHLACEKVDGLIRPEDWCSLFEAAAAAPRSRVRGRTEVVV